MNTKSTRAVVVGQPPTKTKKMLTTLMFDIQEMIDISRKIGEYSQLLLHHNDVSDKRNYDADKCTAILKNLDELYERLFQLKNRWLD